MPFITINISQETVEEIDIISARLGIEPTKLIDGAFGAGMVSFGRVFDALNWGNKERKERTKEKKEKHILLNNNNKTSFLEEGGVGGGTSFLDQENPTEQESPKPKRKTPKRNMPVHWVDIADKDRIPPENLLEYANKKGFDDTQARIMFFDFVNFHLKKGNQFAAWDRAWYTWVRNQIKFGLKSSGDVVRYHKKINPNEGF